MATLYLVSTPIGNIKDITIRALEILWSVDLIVCEDTRETQKLLNEYKEKFDSPYPKLLSYNDHNKDKRIPKILEILQSGQDVAFVSDRGTPLLSDPGYKLVKKVIELEDYGLKIEPVPGANAMLPALQLSGFPPDKFFFVGFLPRKESKQIELIKSFPKTTVIFYESPQRLINTLNKLQTLLNDKPIAVCFELTKMHQKVIRGTISQVVTQLTQNKLKGEITVVLNNRD